MLGLDDTIAGLGDGPGLLMALAVAVLLGMRHATDPDHLTAVSTLVMADEHRGSRRATVLGFSWGLGHATTVIVFGLPIVLFGRGLPDFVQRGAEVAIGAVIIALALRLLVRWRRGYLHLHPHSHGDVRHAHPHVHEHKTGVHAHERAHAVHPHAHADALGRSPFTAFGIGLVHGIGGSAGATILVIATVSSRAEAVGALLLFAGATAVSMALCSTAFGLTLAREAVAARFRAFVPAFGTLSLLFGTWYVLGAIESVPYPF
jgi:ABC-type nickel/cobalt efflux system permease component RcnA